MRAIKNSLLGLTTAAAVQFAGAMTVEASTLTFEGFAAPGSAGVKYKIDGNAKSHGSGAFDMKDEDGNSMLAFCIDLFNTIKKSWDYTEGNSFVPVQNAPGVGGVTPDVAAVTSNLKKLFTAHYQDALTTATNVAAFQLAAWEISVDTTGVGTGLDLMGGRLVQNANGAVYDTAAAYLASVTPGAAENGYKLTFFDSDGSPEGTVSQNLVSATPVPLPAGALLLVTGMAGLGFMRRRRNS